jgi:hypothetical protein
LQIDTPRDASIAFSARKNCSSPIFSWIRWIYFIFIKQSKVNSTTDKMNIARSAKQAMKLSHTHATTSFDLRNNIATSSMRPASLAVNSIAIKEPLSALGIENSSLRYSLVASNGTSGKMRDAILIVRMMAGPWSLNFSLCFLSQTSVLFFFLSD